MLRADICFEGTFDENVFYHQNSFASFLNVKFGWNLKCNYVKTSAIPFDLLEYLFIEIKPKIINLFLFFFFTYRSLLILVLAQISYTAVVV
jgi:hypothetical protein